MRASWQSFRNLLKEFSSGPQAKLGPGTDPVRLASHAKMNPVSLNSSEPQHYDPLTGLPCTDLFFEQVRTVMRSAARNRRLTGVINIGLNDVKRVNDTFGPRLGDVLIRQAGFRLYAAVRQTDALARVGGVNFAVALEPFDSIEEAINVAQRLLDILSETFSLIELAEHHISLSANVGISIFPTHASSAEDLLHQASIALSEAATRGANTIELFSPERREESKTRLELEWRMRRALEQQEFELSYQPEFDLSSGRIVRLEALLRWNGPKGDPISPSTFIPIAEQTGLIVPLGNWVLGEACRMASEWQRGRYSGVGVAVNVSAVQLSRHDFSCSVEAALEEGGLPGELLELELTESALMANFEKTIREVRRLRELGVSIVIDDFGVGYSSLTYLKELPVNGVKLDRSFLRDLQRNPNTLPILRSIVALAHGLRMRVTVEGVESLDELSEVRKLGVDAAQGYLLGRPEAQAVETKTARTGS